MNFNEYSEKAASTAIYPEEVGIIYTTLGLVGEAGEVANKVKKALRDDAGVVTEGRKQMILEELGDVLWYISESARQLGSTLNDVAVINTVKLSDRQKRSALKGDGDVR